MVSDWRSKYTTIFNECKGDRVKLLTERETQAFSLMLDNPDDNLNQLGLKLGISGNRVRQLLEKGAEKLVSGGVVTMDVIPSSGTPRPTRKMSKLVRQDLVRLTQWLVVNKDKVYGLLPDVACALVFKETGIELTEKMIKDVTSELNIKLKEKSRYRVPESQACKVLAGELVRLCTKLGETVSDELWALAGKEEE